MPDRVREEVKKYVSGLHTIATVSPFSSENLATITLFLEGGDRVFLFFHSDGTENQRAPTFKTVGPLKQGHVPVPFSRYEQMLDLIRNESPHVDFKVEDEEILSFRLQSGMEPAGEGEQDD